MELSKPQTNIPEVTVLLWEERKSCAGGIFMEVQPQGYGTST